ncbi:hypothetical protein V8E36_009787 [Tilletia maclaganii]
MLLPRTLVHDLWWQSHQLPGTNQHEPIRSHSALIPHPLSHRFRPPNNWLLPACWRRCSSKHDASRLRRKATGSTRSSRCTRSEQSPAPSDVFAPGSSSPKKHSHSPSPARAHLPTRCRSTPSHPHLAKHHLPVTTQPTVLPITTLISRSTTFPTKSRPTDHPLSSRQDRASPSPSVPQATSLISRPIVFCPTKHAQATTQIRPPLWADSHTPGLSHLKVHQVPNHLPAPPISSAPQSSNVPHAPFLMAI